MDKLSIQVCDALFSIRSLVAESGDLQERLKEHCLIIQQAKHGEVMQPPAEIDSYERSVQNLTEELRCKWTELVRRLSEGVTALMQCQILFLYGPNSPFISWKTAQKRSQIGVEFESRQQQLNDIKATFAWLADWNFELMGLCGQIGNLSATADHLDSEQRIAFEQQKQNLYQMMLTIITRSFIITTQPDPVLKTNHKFEVEVELLLGSKLDLWQKIPMERGSGGQEKENCVVTMKILYEDDAIKLLQNKLSPNNIKPVGDINTTDTQRVSDNVVFRNCKLTRINPRKSLANGRNGSSHSAADQRYALLFSVSPFNYGVLGNIQLWTLSLPVMVTVHGTQDCDAHGAIFWQRAFESIDGIKTPNNNSTTWNNLAVALRYKFKQHTGATRLLSNGDLEYLKCKLLGNTSNHDPTITLLRLTKEIINERSGFSFWEWFYSVMQLVKQRLLKYWESGWCHGFLSKERLTELMSAENRSTFMLRFSETQLGEVSLGYSQVKANGVHEKVSHLVFGAKDLDLIPLSQRILSCSVRYLYPDIDMENNLKKLCEEEPTPVKCCDGYITHKIVSIPVVTGELASLTLAASEPLPTPHTEGVNEKRLKLGESDYSPIDLPHCPPSTANNENAGFIGSNDALYGANQRKVQLEQPFQLDNYNGDCFWYPSYPYSQ